MFKGDFERPPIANSCPRMVLVIVDQLLVNMHKAFSKTPNYYLCLSIKHCATNDSVTGI